MTYQSIAVMSQLTAMAIFGTVLAGVLIYTFWPGNKDRFERAARRPLDNDETPISHAQGDRNG